MKKIIAVKESKGLKAFIDFPHTLYKNDPNYVPELFIAQRDMLTPGKHPFHEHSKVQLFLAYEDQEVIGRIAVIKLLMVFSVSLNAFKIRRLPIC
jgi:hypothetical protein